MFFNGIRLWAQYAEDGHAKYEWEIYSTDYRIESMERRIPKSRSYSSIQTRHKGSQPSARTALKRRALSISIRDIFDSEIISFKVNDPEGDLPLPFPVFGGWTKFEEDEYFE